MVLAGPLVVGRGLRFMSFFGFNMMSHSANKNWRSTSDDSEIFMPSNNYGNTSTGNGVLRLRDATNHTHFDFCNGWNATTIMSPFNKFVVTVTETDR